MVSSKLAWKKCVTCDAVGVQAGRRWSAGRPPLERKSKDGIVSYRLVPIRPHKWRRAAAVVHQFDHFLHLDDTLFSQRSCRTVALWFYILISDRNTTDPVMQKSCNLRRRFFAHFGNVYPYFPSLFQQISFVTLI
jgi:hypothetical protein